MQDLYLIGALPWWLVALVALATVALLVQQFIGLKQRLALGQTLGQPIAGSIALRIFLHDFEFDVLQRGVELNQEFFHIVLAPTSGPTARRLDFGAIQRLQRPADGAGVEGHLHGLFEDRA